MLTIAVAAAAVALSAGCVRKSTHQRVLKELNACQGELGTCQTKASEQETKISELESSLVDTRKERDDEKAARAEAESRLGELEQNMETTRAELDELRKQREAANKRLDSFRKLNERFRALVDTGKLQVTFRNGQMVLKLPAGILFGSGKADLSKEGKEALAEVTTILLEFKDRRFVIAGHTDDRAIRTRQFKNNWALSTARAVSVVQFMIEAGFSPKNLAAAGYGEFDPVESNETPEGRQLNRRIEIILVPDLSELPTLTAEPTK